MYDHICYKCESHHRECRIIIAEAGPEGLVWRSRTGDSFVAKYVQVSVYRVKRAKPVAGSRQQQPAAGSKQPAVGSGSRQQAAGSGSCQEEAGSGRLL
jgi:hypothetical protein